MSEPRWLDVKPDIVPVQEESGAWVWEAKTERGREGLALMASGQRLFSRVPALPPYAIVTDLRDPDLEV